MSSQIASLSRLVVAALTVTLLPAVCTSAAASDWKIVYPALRQQSTQPGARRHAGSHPRNSAVTGIVRGLFQQANADAQQRGRNGSALSPADSSAAAGHQTLQSTDDRRDPRGSHRLARPAGTTVMPLPAPTPEQVTLLPFSGTTDRQTRDAAVAASVRGLFEQDNADAKRTQQIMSALFGPQPDSSDENGRKTLQPTADQRDPDGRLTLAQPAPTMLMPLPVPQPSETTLMPLPAPEPEDVTLLPFSDPEEDEE